MATLLVTRKMSPELAARVQASVQGRRAEPGARLTPRSVSLLRVGLLAVLVAGVAWFVQTRQRVRQELDSARALLLSRVRRESASLTREDRALPSRVEAWLLRSAGAYPGDFVADELRTASAFAAVLTRPMLYVRGPVEDLRGERGVEASAARSFRDAFVLCLVAPPPSKDEKFLLGRARSAYSGGARTERSLHVERFASAIVGLPFLMPAWEERVREADDRELDRLALRLDRAPLEGARRAAKARLLLFVMDEPGDPGGPTELDGERAHPVRVGLVDLAADRALLVLRRRVDPSGLSASSRAEFASGMDSCALALDVHSAVHPVEALSRKE